MRESGILKRKKTSGKKIFITAVILIILWLFGIYLYITYTNIDINNNYEAERVQSTNTVQTVESVEQNSKNVADMMR